MNSPRRLHAIVLSNRQFRFVRCNTLERLAGPINLMVRLYEASL
jgi:hypothetical protein